MDIVKRALEIANELGVDEIEIFYGRTISRAISVEKNIVKPTVTDMEGLAFRVAKNKNISFSYTYELSEEKIREAIKIAMRSAELKGPDENYAGFPNFGSITSEFVSDEITDISLGELLGFYETIYEEISKIKRVVPIGCGSGYVEGHYRIVNTNGVDTIIKGNVIFFSIYALTKEIPPNYVFRITVSRSRDIDMESIVESIKEKAERILGCKEIRYSGAPELIFSPSALFQMLMIFLRQINASQIKAGMSPYKKDDIDKEILSPKISIIDDPMYDKGIFMSKVDFEGTPAKKKYLVEKGKLRTILNDYYHAKALEIEPSANTIRYSMWGSQDPVMVEPNIMPWFLRFEGEEKSFEKIISGIDDGFLIEDVMGVHQADPVSGKFAVPALAVRIKGGELAYPIRKVMLSCTMRDLLRNVEAISKERENFGYGEYPYLKTRGIVVSSEKSSLRHRLSMKIANFLMRIGIIKF